MINLRRHCRPPRLLIAARHGAARDELQGAAWQVLVPLSGRRIQRGVRGGVCLVSVIENLMVVAAKLGLKDIDVSLAGVDDLLCALLQTRFVSVDISGYTTLAVIRHTTNWRHGANHCSETNERRMSGLSIERREPSWSLRS